MDRRIFLFSGLTGFCSTAFGNHQSPTEVQFYIYYIVPDKAFRRAAYTALKKKGYHGNNERMARGVRTKEDFIKAWKFVLSTANRFSAKVTEGHVFTHASKQNNGQDGLEFAPGGSSSTLTRQDIQALPRLPWLERNRCPHLVLHGCNTGLKGGRGWCPAKEFAKSQNIYSYGEVGYSYFSTREHKYASINRSSKEVYLNAYKRGRNSPFGNGTRMKGMWFDP